MSGTGVESFKSGPNHNYLALREDVHDPLRPRRTNRAAFTQTKADWQQGLSTSQLTARSMLVSQWGQLMDDRTGYQVLRLTKSYTERTEASEQLLVKIGQMYGIPGSVPEVGVIVSEYARQATDFMDKFTESVAYPGAGHLGGVNEVNAETDPMNLLLMTVDRGWAPKARFEAKRKLLLMGIAASIDRRQRTTGLTSQFGDFGTWLGENVWSPDWLKGESEGAYLVSNHDPETWACPSAFTLSQSEGKNFQPEPYQKVTQLLRREFIARDGTRIQGFVSSREKDLTSKMEKMLRKRSENPGTAVDDDLGLMAVFEGIEDIRKFLDITINPLQGKRERKLPILLEEISDTLGGGEYNGNSWSSPHIRMLKVFLRIAYQSEQMQSERTIGHMRPELILHTPATYAENLYMRGVGHTYYEINRRLKTGIGAMLLPGQYYEFDERQSAEYALERARREIEDTQPQTNANEPGIIIQQATETPQEISRVASLMEKGKRFWRGFRS